MVKRTLIAVMLINLTCALASGEEPKDPRLEEFIQEIQKGIEKGTTPKIDSSYFTRLQAAASANDIERIELMLGPFTWLLRNSPQASKCLALYENYGEKRAAKQKEEQQKITAALSRAKDAIAKAKSPDDLDETIQELTQLKNRERSSSAYSYPPSDDREIWQSLDFLIRWQKYLSALGAKDLREARNLLANLSDGDSARPCLIARSELLDRSLKLEDLAEKEQEAARLQEVTRQIKPPLQFDSSSQRISFDIKNLEQLDSAVQSLKALKPFSNSKYLSKYQEIRISLESLEPLNDAYQKHLAGIETGLPILPRGRSIDSIALRTQLIPLQKELLLLILPRYLGIPPETKAKATESVDDFLQRIKSEAIVAEDYSLASRAQEAKLLIQEGPAFKPRKNLQATYLLDARNQETKGALSLAAAAYQRALADGTALVPPSLIGERLAKIKQTAPEEYEQGIVLFLANPDPISRERKSTGKKSTRKAGQPNSPSTPNSATSRNPRLP